MPFIKSHSNYVLKKKHQDVSDGTIFERDITTIGAVDQFSPGQTPIYRSNNFIITVRNDGKPSNQYNSTKWKENDSGETWTLQTVSGMVSDYEDDNDTKIVLKQDYYDFRDFAYYGSLTELFRASVTDIMARFPGELYVTDEHAYYTVRQNIDFEKIEEREPLGGDNYFFVSNPFGIDLYTNHLPNGADFLKFFAEDGFLNYQVTSSKTDSSTASNGCTDIDLEEDFVWDDITRWTVEFSDPCCSCSNLIIPQESKTIRFDNTGGTKTVNIELKECLSAATLNVSSLDWLTTSLNGKTLTITAGKSEKAESGEIVITAKSNSTVCKAKINVSQEAPAPEPCDCTASINTSVSEMSFGSTGGTSSFTISISDSCVDANTIGVSSDGQWVQLDGSGTNWTVTVGSHTTKRSATIKISASTTTGVCTVDKIEVSQTNYCECKDLTITKLDDNQNTSTNSASNTRMRGALLRANDESEETAEELYRRFAAITINTAKYGAIKIYAYLDDDNNVVYLVKGESLKGYHIRPKREFLDKFFSECDNFEKLLVNEDTHYKATFSVIRENDFGYYREFVPFQFPIGYGGYNLDVASYGFDAYTTQMVQIGEYYDENFTDNLWRSMTHEAIKNFDWSYTREYEQGDEQEYVIGGQRIQKALRIFAREFDEIISYINNIKNLNRVTYDERSNIPDYFLTDTLENEGWDVKLVYPYSLTEYSYVEVYYFENTKYDTKDAAIAAAREKYPQKTDKEIEELVKAVEEKQICEDSKGVTCEEGDEECEEVPNTEWTEGGDSCDGQLNNIACGRKIIRDFSQNSTNKIKPYTQLMIGDGSESGYFVICKGCINVAQVTATAQDVPCEGGSVTVKWTKTSESEKARMEIPTPCGYVGEDSPYMFVSADCDSVLPDSCALGGDGALKNRIKTYTDETEWSYQQVNNEFLRRLKLNSRYIWRHKGTVEGIEMILGMFGMKSKKWVESHPEWEINCKYVDDKQHMMWDYDVQEYTSFTSRIEETWDAIHQNYRINWINSTKTITYDNRFVSNYNRYGANGNIMAYQGIPVAFREAYLSQQSENYDPYLSYGEGANKQYYHDERNNKIIKRYLYPYFDKNEQLDGHPYFQMRGGWLAKTLLSVEENNIDIEHPWYNFQFDVDNKIVYTNYLKKGSVSDDGFINDNKFLFKETVRNIRRVDDIGKLLSIPTIELHNGIICNVTRIEKQSAVIDNVVYPITKIWYVPDGQTEGSVKEYISFVKTEGYIKVGNSKFFDTSIIVYDIDGNEFNCNVEEKSDGYELKAYIKDGAFICKEDPNGYYSISNFQILDELPTEGFTNYFILDDINYADVLGKYDEETSEWTSGWRRLSIKDRDYMKVNTIINYYNGNNPHNGNMVYDNGHDYFTYYGRLFKYASDNDLFDERCYEDYYATLDDEIIFYGFNGLIEENEDILQYDDFLVPDTKIHYFGNYKVKKNIDKEYEYCYKGVCYSTITEALTKVKTDYPDKRDDYLINNYIDIRYSKWNVDIAKSNGVPNVDKIWIYGDDTYRLSGDVQDVGGFDVIYLPETTTVKGYNVSASTVFNNNGWVEKNNPYNDLIDIEDTVKEWNEQEQKYVENKVKRYPVMDEVTNQIVNNKIFDITFRLHNKWYTKEGQEELKYIDDVVMNYLTHMIPSTTILRIKYALTDVIPTEIVREKKETQTTTENESTSETYSYTFKYDESNCGSRRPVGTVEHWGKMVTIYQVAGPCDEGQTKYTFEDVEVNCEAHNNEEIQVPYTAVTTVENCKSKTEEITGKMSYIVNEIPCNDGNETKDWPREIPGKGSFTIHQKAGEDGEYCCPIVCDCNMMEFSTVSETWDAATITERNITLTNTTKSTSNCISDDTITLDTSSLSHFSATLSEDKSKITVKPNGKNTTEGEIKESFFVKYDSVSVDKQGTHTVNCKQEIKLEHSMSSCQCSSFTLSETSETWEYNDRTQTSITITIVPPQNDCIDDVALNTSSLSHFSATLSNDKTKITVYPNENNTGATNIVETFKVSYTANTNTCSPKTITLTHKPEACDCGNLTLAPTLAEWAWDVTTTSSITVSSGACISEITLSNPSHFTATKGNKVITVKPNSKNETGSLITETLTVSYKAHGEPCPNPRTVTLKHNPKTCVCEDLTIKTPEDD